jgi:rod shape-determining protein MreC
MSNLFAFFARYYRFFLFLILEIFSFYMLVSYNRYQKVSFFNSTYEVSGEAYTLYNNINLYFHLKTANDSLLSENARLRATQVTSQYVDTGKVTSNKDTIYKQKFTFLPARVVNNSINKLNNYLTLDIGSSKNITKDMGIVTSSGIVGITRAVSPHFSSVLSVLNENFTISASIKETKDVGSINWDGKNPDIVILRDIGIKSRIRKDSVYHVVTSSFSKIFPEGIPIGTIDHFETKLGSKFLTIYVKLAENLQNVQQVYVINNIMRAEQEKVETVEKPK